ncbi:MAG TPA: DUF47 family protein [Solirubrobacteraceae bacterium]|nr:DUF47 family protein [Solirubrobacteraceae bacterium]
MATELVACEHDGDRIAHDIIHRLHDGRGARRGVDSLDGHRLATALDDIVDESEHTADVLRMYRVEAPMEHACLLADVLVGAGAEVARALRALRDGGELRPHLIAIHRLENEGDRPSRDAIASLFAAGIDPMVVIRWKDIFESLEASIDAGEHVAHVLEGIAISAAGSAASDAAPTARQLPCGAVNARRLALAPLCAALTVLAVAACGGGSDSGSDSDTGRAQAPPGVSQQEFERRLAEAASATEADFPPAAGRTLQAIADTVQAGPQLGLATSVFTPGDERLAFGLIDQSNNFIYGKTAVYIARDPSQRALGPFPAPADALVTKPAFRSQNAAVESSPIAQIYATKVPFERAGRYAVLAVTKQGSTLVGAPAEVQVKRRTRIPDVGDRPPAIATDTVASAAGNLAAIDTRRPFARELHETSFKDVLGRKPVALLFATPQLCQSRVCGPVVDIELQMQEKYGDRMTFIHQEVYRDNQVDKGLRPSLRAFGLQTEPWLFTVDADGRIAARLEGSFGVKEFEQAVRAALR